MILEAIVATKALTYAATTLYALIAGTAAITGGVTILGTAAIMKRKHSRLHSKNKRRLISLEDEQKERDAELPKSLSRLVVQSDTLVTTASSNTLEIRGQIATMTATLDDEVKTTQKATGQLQSVTALLGSLSDKVSNDLKPVISELQDRLINFNLIHDELRRVHSRFLHTIEHLQSAVQKHTKVQKTLEVDARKDKEIILSLSSKLNEAVQQLSHASVNVDDIDHTVPTAVGKLLVLRLNESQSQNQVYKSMMHEASEKITTLRQQNGLLRSTVESLTTELTEAQEPTAFPITHSARNITMFHP